MSTLNKYLQNICFIISVMALASFTLTPISYSSSNDDNHLSANDSIYSPPGYMNKDIQQARTLTNKYLANKDKADNKTEATQREVSQKVQVQEKPKPELKQKQSSGGKSQAPVSAQLIDSAKYNVKIGSGADKAFDANGKLISETIDGQRHVYVGFTNSSKTKIVDGINQAKKEGGGIVIVKAGTYNESYVNMVNGVSLYGGYNELGQRDVKKYATTVKGYFSGYNISSRTELNGFTISGARYAINIGGNTGGWIILNNTMRATYMNISSSGNATIYNNDIAGTGWAVHSWGSYYGSLRFINNIVHHTSWGFTDAYGSKSIVENNLFYDNGGAAIISHDKAGTIIRNNTFASTKGVGIGVRYFGAAPTIENNIFYNLKNAFSVETWWYGGGRKTGASTFNLKNNVFYNNATFGISDASLAKGINVGNMYSLNPGIDPTKSLYTSIFTDKGYSAAAVNTTYSTFQFGNAAMLSMNKPAASSQNIVSLPLYYGLQYKTQDTQGAANKGVLAKDKGMVSGDFLAFYFKSLLKAKKDGEAGDMAMASQIRPDMVNSFLLGINISADKLNPDEMQAASILKSALSNPTEDQKAVLDVAASIMKSLESIQDPGATNKAITDEFAQIVASVLITQAMPDLLNKGDAASIKTLFSDLNTQKNNLLIEYQKSTKPYYDNVLKDLAKNMSTLQLKNVLKNDMSKDELGKLPPSELDKILEKIKDMKSRAFEEEYILQQEAKYRKEYLEPGKEKLQNDMKGMMKSFTGKINDVLKSAEKK